jgi:hypothetical protein
LPAPEFFALAIRLPAYPGVMRMRSEEEDRKANRNTARGAKVVDSTPEAIERDPLLSGLIEFS